MAAATAGTLGLLLAAAWIGVPLPAGDQDYFLPVATLRAETGELAHPFFSPVAGAPDLRFDWHGWLMPDLHARLMPPGGYERALVPGAVLGAVSVLLWGLLILRTAGPGPAAVALPVLACLASYQTGRPELPAGLFLAPLALAVPRGPRAAGLQAGALALLAVTAPAVAVAAGLLVAVRVLEAEPRLARAALLIAGMGLLSALGAALLTERVAGLPVSGWLSGLAAHAAVIAAREDGGALLHYALLQPRMPGLAPLLALLPLWLGLLWRRRGPGLWCLPAGLLLAWFWYAGLRIPPTIYNVAALVPLLLLLAGRELAALPRLRRAVCLALVPVSLAAAIALAGQSVTAVAGLAGGVRAESLREALRALPEGTRVRTGSVALGMIARETLGPQRVLHGEAPGAAAIRLVAQAYSGADAPALGAGECVLASTFAPGLRLRKDWAFALVAPCPP